MSVAGDPQWNALAAWGDFEICGSFRTGSINAVRAVNVNGLQRVARRSSRNERELDWEVELLVFLRDSGLAVPRLVSTPDGRLRVGTLIVMEHVEGRPAETDDDLRLVAGYLHRLHELTTGWPTQRPGWQSCVDLVNHDTSGPVDLRRLPAPVVERCRRAWARLRGLPVSVIHGDPNPSNIRMTPDGGVVLLDWDEARLDVSCLDLARPPMPQPFSGLDETTFEAALHGFRAWEAAMFWHTVPEHARKQLARVP